MKARPPGFAELVAATNYSFLRGASPPSDMASEAHELGLAAIGIADRNSVAGVVRAYAALKQAPERARAAMLADKQARGEALVLDDAEEATLRMDLRLLVGARLVFADGTPDIVAYPTTRRGWGRLTRLLTRGNLRAVKGDCILGLTDLLDHLDELLLIVLPDTTADAQQPHRAPVAYPADAPLAPRLELLPAPGPSILAETLHAWRGGPRAASGSAPRWPIAATMRGGWTPWPPSRPARACPCWPPATCCMRSPTSASCTTC